MWDRRYSAPGLAWGAEPNRRLVAEVEALPPGRALDLGAGEGRNAVWLAARGWDVTAVDFSRAGLARCEAMAAEAGVAVTTVVADAGDYAPDEGAFDLVAIMYLQVPADVLARALVRCAHALAPGGTLVLIAHDRDNLEHGYGGPQDPAVLPTAGQVVDALGGGLVIEHAGQVNRGVDTPDGERVAIDLLVRARRPG